MTNAAARQSRRLRLATAEAQQHAPYLVVVRDGRERILQALGPFPGAYAAARVAEEERAAARELPVQRHYSVVQLTPAATGAAALPVAI